MFKFLIALSLSNFLLWWYIIIKEKHPELLTDSVKFSVLSLAMFLLGFIAAALGHLL